MLTEMTIDDKERRVNIGMSISRNFQTIKLEVQDHPITLKTDEEFKTEVRRVFSLLKGELEHQFDGLMKK